MSLVRAWAAAFDGDPASLARDNIYSRTPVQRTPMGTVPSVHLREVVRS